MALTFHKMHSLGNDFVVVDAISQNVHLQPAQIRWLGDRHRGIGFDQLLLIEPPTDPEADFTFRIYNADGSEAQQCGNGTRAAALLVNRLGLSRKKTIVWQSLAGSFSTEFTDPSQIETTMTVPVLSLAKIPFDDSAAQPAQNEFEFRQFTLSSTVGDFVVTPVSMGNPHAVTLVDDVQATDVPGIGAALTEHPAYPERANVGFCQVVDEQFVRLRVFERGTGETLACGSGACAAVVATTSLGLTRGKVKVSLPGGKLRIHWPGPGERVIMAGDANLVFSSDVTIPGGLPADTTDAADEGDNSDTDPSNTNNATHDHN